MTFRQPLLARVNIECRDMIRMFPQLGEETALAGTDFKNATGQRKDFREDEFEARGRIVAEAAKQRLAFRHGLVVADGFGFQPAHGLPPWLSFPEVAFGSAASDSGVVEQLALPNAGIPICARFHPGNPVIWNQ
jgi:hypothetical protein